MGYSDGAWGRAMKIREVILDRLKGMNFKDEEFKIAFDWSQDPDERKIVDMLGFPTGSR